MKQNINTINQRERERRGDVIYGGVRENHDYEYVDK